MKVRVHLKDPDGFGDAVREAAMAEAVRISPGADQEQRDALAEIIEGRAWEALKRWVEYREYLAVEFDLGAMTAVVVKKRE